MLEQQDIPQQIVTENNITMKRRITMNVSEKAAYIKGLVDGLELDGTTKEGKVLAAIIDLLGDIL